jgi:hypothetical protein
MMEGLLGGLADLVGGYFGRVQAAKQAAMESPYRAQLQGLLGAPADNPEAAGLQGPAFAGSGLLANQQLAGDPMVKFAAGVMGMPGGVQMGANLLQNAVARLQQGEQFTQQQKERRAEFNDQFGLQQQEAVRRQWEGIANREDRRAEFDANQQWREQQARFEQQRIGLQAQGLADQRARDAVKPGIGEKLPVGYAPVMSPLGPVAMPMPGTKPYADAKATDETLTQAQARLGELVGMIEGVETTTPRGRKVKTGGMGATELWGEDAAKFSQLRSQVIADVAVLRNLGVLQGAEWEKIDEVLPDPTKLGSVFRRQDSTAKAYKTQRDLFKDATQRHRNSNPWLLPPVPQ